MESISEFLLKEIYTKKRDNVRYWHCDVAVTCYISLQLMVSLSYSTSDTPWPAPGPRGIYNRGEMMLWCYALDYIITFADPPPPSLASLTLPAHSDGIVKSKQNNNNSAGGELCVHPWPLIVAGNVWMRASYITIHNHTLQSITSYTRQVTRVPESEAPSQILWMLSFHSSHLSVYISCP